MVDTAFVLENIFGILQSMDDKQKILSYLRKYQLMSVATYGDTPWIANVYYAVDNDLNLYFYSDPKTIHCQHIRKNKNVAVSVYDSTQTPVQQAHKFDKIGIQLYGEAKELTNWIELGRGLILWRKALHIKTEDMLNVSLVKKVLLTDRIYKIIPKKIKLFKQDKAGTDSEVLFEQ